MKEIHPELVLFIEKRLGIVENISKNSPIESSYGMAGLDSLVFYDDFIREFEIELPEGFDIRHYTTSDLWLFDSLKRLFSEKYRKKYWYVDVTIGDLEEMIRTKKWQTRGKFYTPGDRYQRIVRCFSTPHK